MDSLAFVGVLHMCKRKHQGCLCLNFPAKSPVRSPQAQTSLRATRLRLWVFCSKLYCPRDKVSCRLLPTYAVSTKSSSAPSTYHSSWNDRPKISPFANLSTWYAAWVRLSRKHPETRRYPKVIYLDDCKNFVLSRYRVLRSDGLCTSIFSVNTFSQNPPDFFLLSYSKLFKTTHDNDSASQCIKNIRQNQFRSQIRDSKLHFRLHLARFCIVFERVCLARIAVILRVVASHFVPLPFQFSHVEILQLRRDILRIELFDILKERTGGYGGYRLHIWPHDASYDSQILQLVKCRSRMHHNWHPTQQPSKGYDWALERQWTVMSSASEIVYTCSIQYVCTADIAGHLPYGPGNSCQPLSALVRVWNFSSKRRMCLLAHSHIAPFRLCSSATHPACQVDTEKQPHGTSMVELCRTNFQN